MGSKALAIPEFAAGSHNRRRRRGQRVEVVGMAAVSLPRAPQQSPKI
jgi:hypothetical protein